MYLAIEDCLDSHGLDLREVLARFRRDEDMASGRECLTKPRAGGTVPILAAMTTTTQDSPGLVPYLIFASFAFWTLWTTWLFFTRRNEKPALRSVAILVLGDIGRSPRMMYHAESFAKNNFDTFLIGNRGALYTFHVSSKASLTLTA